MGSGRLSLHDALPILALLPFLISCLIWLDLVASLPNQATYQKRQECRDRKSGSAGMPRPISYAVFCLKKKKKRQQEARTSAARTPLGPPSLTQHPRIS